MDETAQGRSFRNIFSRQKIALQITAYQVGDIHTTQSVEIGANATLVGHIVAPIVHVYGLVYGSVLAQETAVYPGGQIWGDVYTTRLTLESGGSIHGWTDTIEDVDFEEYAQNLTPPQPDPPEIPGDIQIALPDKVELEQKKILQQSAALALAARAELEESFDLRLNEMAGKVIKRNKELAAELETAVAELNAIRPQYEKAQDDLAAQISQHNQLSQEIQIARNLLAEREVEIAALQDKSKAAQTTIDALAQKHKTTEAALKSKEAAYASMLARHESLETALQASLEHTSDLEESLLRWQELAEYSESRAKELEEKQNTLQTKLEVAQAAHAKIEEEQFQLKDDLKGAQATIDKQKRLLKQLKDASSQKINDLQKQLESK